MSRTVTIGIPAYRNELTIERAIKSVLAQTYTDWRLVISDDASPDRTADICDQYASQRENIELIRQSKNLYYMNFRYVLERADTPYFVWLAGDDYWSPGFLEACIDFLSKNPEYVCCVPRTQFVGKDGSTLESAGTRTLERDVVSNICCYLDHPMDNSRLYGVYRTQGLIDCFPPEIMHAWDWAFSASTLALGKHRELDEFHLYREKTEGIDYSRAVYRDETRTLYRIFPILHMSYHMISNNCIPVNWKIFLSLLSLNMRKNEEQLAAMHPDIYKKLSFLYKYFINPIQSASRRVSLR